MRILSSIVVCLGLFVAPDTGLSTEVTTVNEFIRTLMPHQLDAFTGQKEKPQTRGLGGAQEIKPRPSMAMHLTFSLNSAELNPSSRATLDNLGRALENVALRNYLYKLEGHTCDLGSAEYNRELSRQRALAVRNYLADNCKINIQQLEVAWFGEDKPSVPNLNEKARSQNRRVMIINTLKDFDQPVVLKQPAMLQVKCLRGNSEETIADGDVVKGEDRYAVEFDTATDLHVYIFQLDAVGKMTPLFPNEKFSNTNNPIPANTNHRLPASGQWFYLDANTGQEQIVLIAAKEPITETEDLCNKVTSGWVQVTAGWTTSTEIAKYAKSNTKMRGLGGVIRVEPKNSGNMDKALETSAEPVKAPNTGTDLYVVQRYFQHQK